MDEATKTKLFQSIGAKIRQARLGKKSQQELADNLGFTRTSVTNFETGNQRVQIDTLWQIADILGVEFHDLLPTKDEMGNVFGQIPEDIDINWVEGIKEEVKNRN